MASRISLSALDIVQTHEAFLTKAVPALQYYLRYNKNLNQHDTLYVDELLTHILYVNLIFARIKKDHGFTTLDNFDFGYPTQEVVSILTPMVDNPKHLDVSMISLGKCLSHLEDIIKAYHAPQQKKSLISGLMGKRVNHVRA